MIEKAIKKFMGMHPFLILEWILFIDALLICIIRPEWVGAWLDSPEWFGGTIPILFVMLAMVARIERKYSELQTKLINLMEGDKE